MSRLRAGVALSVLFVIVVASRQGLTAFGAPPPAPSPYLAKAQSIAAEQTRAASAGQSLAVGRGESLIVKDVITDGDGSTHVRYNRTYNGLRVIGGDLVSHRDKSAKVRSVTRNTSAKLAVASTKPKVSLAAAVGIGAKKAAFVRGSTLDTKGDLVVYAGGVSMKARPKLAYDVLTKGVRADQTPSRLHTIVDAISGVTLASWDEIQTGTGNGIHVGTVTLGTRAGPPWSMRDVVGNYTTDLKGVVDNIGAVPGATFVDTDNLWGNGLVTDRASAGVDAHYGAGKTFDYFQKVHGRNGVWNTGVGVRSRVHFGNNYANAYWDGSQVTYGDGAGNTHPMVQLDIAGHEMTHGISESTAGLTYEGEAGGLSEATSDIFGTSIEWYANNAADKPDYLIGELIDANGNGTPVRYMDQPSRDGASPDCWSPKLGSLDVHNSSGPLNHWFFLASEGSGPKDINGVSYNSPTCNASTVTAVGREKAAKIWYRTLTTYLTSNSTYAAAREGAIQSAKDLYGASSPECVNIAASFSAVDVPPGPANCGLTPSPPLGGNLLRNPGFEAGPADWAGPAGPISNSTGRPSRSGSWKMWLGGKGAATTQKQWQSMTIPYIAIAPKLSYWIRTDTAEPGSTAFDTLKVQIVSSTTTSTLATYSNVGASPTYSQKTHDLSAYKGKSITVMFVMTEDDLLQTSFVVDDTAITTAPLVIFSPVDFTGDGRSDLLAVRGSGALYLNRGNGLGGFAGSGASIGSGWGGYVIVLSPGDFTGDGKSDLLAVRGSGELYLYRGNGLGGFAGPGTRIGAGWGGFAKVLSPRDFTGDGKSDLLAVRGTGELYLYRGNGLGGLAGSGTRIGTGWGGFVNLISPRDFTGDGKSDLLAVKSSGELYLYRGNGLGGLSGPGTRIGAGWL